ncbi:hypothetical protein T265_15759, partial [Opisthorchis viverrini]
HLHGQRGIGLDYSTGLHISAYGTGHSRLPVHQPHTIETLSGRAQTEEQARVQKVTHPQCHTGTTRAESRCKLNDQCKSFYYNREEKRCYQSLYVDSLLPEAYRIKPN